MHRQPPKPPGFRILKQHRSTRNPTAHLKSRAVSTQPGPKADAASCQSLQEGGANIEGLAARGGNLYVGFRAPSVGGRAFVVRVAEKAVFGPAAPELQVLRANLGQDASGRDLGIRDIAAVADGFLILAGPSLPEGDDT